MTRESQARGDPRDRNGPRRAAELTAALLPLLVLATGLIGLQLSSAPSAAIEIEAQRLRSRVQDVLAAGAGPLNVPIEARAKVLLRSLADRDINVRVLRPDGTLVAASASDTAAGPAPSPSASAGATVPPSGVCQADEIGQPSDEQREEALRTGGPVQFQHGGCLTILTRIDTQTDPSGLVSLTAPVDHVAGATSNVIEGLPLAGIVGSVALLLSLALIRRLRRPLPVLRASPSGVSPDQQELVTSLTDERNALLEAIIEVRDDLRSETLGHILDRALEKSGVQRVAADGELFDLDRHHAVDRLETPDARLHDRVASTERAGYQDHGLLIRLPDVIVYQPPEARG